ncbi:hypothetical protein FWH58_00525 [Candidatus Saccharibacteria bacterium]|nr:hypothetical protein [Candidatus Saccharibacteria bacterium]
MILAIKTNQDPAEIYLLTSDGKIIVEKKWNAGRLLAKNLLSEIEQLVIASAAKQSRKKSLDCHGDKSLRNDNTLKDLSAIIIFRGPGSFTGLRIGITVANTISHAQEIPIVGTNGENWLDDGMKKLSAGENNKIVLPWYGAPANITKPKK